MVTASGMFADSYHEHSAILPNPLYTRCAIPLHEHLENAIRILLYKCRFGCKEPFLLKSDVLLLIASNDSCFRNDGCYDVGL